MPPPTVGYLVKFNSAFLRRLRYVSLEGIRNHPDSVPDPARHRQPGARELVDRVTRRHRHDDHPRRLTARAALVAAFAVVSVMLGACSASRPSSSSEARSVVQRYYAALERGNGASACALLSESAKEEVVSPLKLFRDLKPVTDCATMVRRHAALMRKLAGDEIGAVTLMSDRATVTVTKPGTRPHEVLLVKTPSGWRISKLDLGLRKPIGG